MKKFLLVIGFTLGAVATTACSQRSAPDLVASEHIASNAGKLSPVYTDGKCHFRIKVVQGQRYSDKDYIFEPTKGSPAGWAFGIGCRAGASRSDIDEQLAAKQVNGKWIWLPAHQPFKPKQHFKLIRFSGKNWKGVGVAVDQIYYAPPNQRSRFFNFCLIENNGPQVLCGRTQIRGVTQPDSASKLPKIMTVLRTIVFVDPSATPTSASSSAGAH